jgi:alkaline phosphatase D
MRSVREDTTTEKTEHTVGAGVGGGSLDRRRFLALGGGMAAALAATNLPRAWAGPGSALAGGDSFAFGVASGDPLPDSMVLWTRVAQPATDGRASLSPVPVSWELAADEQFRRVLQRGRVAAHGVEGHSVHVEPKGLEAGTWYWYRFQAAGHVSPSGRTKTAPAAGSSPERLRFAFVSCQDWQAGFYPAYGHLAEEDLDLVVHLGDYIYEDGPQAGGPAPPRRAGAAGSRRLPPAVRAVATGCSVFCASVAPRTRS